MAVTQTAEPVTSVIFGAKGDLARRKLLPFPVSTGKSRSAQPGHPDYRRKAC